MKPAISTTILALAGCCGGYGQSADPPPAFEVASIKPAPPIEGMRAFRIGCSGGPGTSSPGLYNCDNSDLGTLIMQAYGLKKYQVPSATGDADRYNITAKIPEGTTKAQTKLMLQNLLAERFKLTYHYEKKEMAVYELTVAKGGPKMKQSPDEPPPAGDGVAPLPPPPSMSALPKDEDGFPIVPRRKGMSSMSIRNGLFHWASFDTGMDALAGMLSQQVDRPITDSTGLKGKYDVTLTFLSPNSGVRTAASSESSAGGAVSAATDPEGMSIFAAVQKYLGLKLEQAKGTIDIFVIDHAEKRPTEN